MADADPNGEPMAEGVDRAAPEAPVRQRNERAVSAARRASGGFAGLRAFCLLLTEMRRDFGHFALQN